MTNPITINSTKTVTSIIRNGTAIEKMMLAWEWQPQGLFLGDVQAAWYDPVDTGNDDWRRNFLTFSENFETAVWVKADACSVAADTVASPLGDTTADTITFGASVNGRASQPVTIPAGAYTFSVWLRADSPVSVRIGEVLNSPTVVNVTDSWQRFTFSGASTGGSVSIGVQNASPTGLRTVYAWGAQLDLGSVATPYQPIADVNTEVSALFPNNTMFQDNTGSAPNAAASSNQATGLWLDKSKLLALGQNIFSDVVALQNGGTDGFYSAGSIGNTVVGGLGYPRFRWAQPGLVVGKSYRVTITYTGPSVWTFVLADNAVIAGAAGNLGTGSTLSFLFTYTGVDNRIVLYANGSAFSGSISLSVRELSGNHALQTSTSLRPLFGRSPVSRRNLFIRTEEFGNGVWVKGNATVSSNSLMAPNGAMTATKFIPNTIFNQHSIEQVPIVQPIAGGVVLSAYFKAGELNKAVIRTYDDTNLRQALFNLSTGAVETGTNTVAAGQATILDVGDGWFLCRLLAGFTKGSALKCNFRLAPASTTATDPGAGWAGNNIDGGFIWGAQLEAGSVATPYQKVVTALDITEAGKPSYAFMRPDLSDDKLTTNMASTKNLLQYTEEFDNAAWIKFAVTVTANATTAPDGTNTSYKIVENTALSAHRINFSKTAPSSPTVFSVYLKAAERTWAILSYQNGGDTYFDLANGTIGTLGGGVTASISPASNGFYRCQISVNTVTSGCRIQPAAENGVGSYTGDGTSGIFVWGAQFETGSTATPYEYGGFKGDILVAGKNGSVFQSDVVSPTGVMDLGPLEYTGGTPGILRAVGDVVGYTMARKKFSDVEKAQLVRYYKKRGAKGLLMMPGPELVANGNFTIDSDWTKGTGWTISDGVAKANNPSGSLSQIISLITGRSYEVTFTVSNSSGTGQNGTRVRFEGGTQTAFFTTLGNGTKKGILVAGVGNNTIAFYQTGNDDIFDLDNISVRELRPEEEW